MNTSADTLIMTNENESSADTLIMTNENKSSADTLIMTNENKSYFSNMLNPLVVLVSVCPGSGLRNCSMDFLDTWPDERHIGPIDASHFSFF